MITSLVDSRYPYILLKLPFKEFCSKNFLTGIWGAWNFLDVKSSVFIFCKSDPQALCLHENRTHNIFLVKWSSQQEFLKSWDVKYIRWICRCNLHFPNIWITKVKGGYSFSIRRKTICYWSFLKNSLLFLQFEPLLEVLQFQCIQTITRHALSVFKA